MMYNIRSTLKKSFFLPELSVEHPLTPDLSADLFVHKESVPSGSRQPSSNGRRVRCSVCRKSG